MNLIVLKHTQLDAYFTTQHVEHAKWIIEHTSMEYDDPPKKWDAYSYLVVFYFKEPLGVSYFQFKSIEDVKHLANLHNLSILSLAGNPFLSALNYVTFIKMLIPSLLILDSKDANQSIVSTNVYPH